MATGVLLRSVALCAALLLAACQQDTPAPAPAAATAPVLRHDDAVLALLKQRYGAQAQLKGQWAQQLKDPNFDHVRPIHREVCADQGVDLAGNRYRMLAVCTQYDDASAIELGSSDFIVLREANDGAMTLAAELPDRASGVGGKPGTISLLQVGGSAWAYQIDDELVAVGSLMRNRAWMVFDGGDKIADAGWLRVHLDNHNAIECNAAGNCAKGALDLNLKVQPDDSQADLPHWPLKVQETGNGCHGRVNKAQVISYDATQARYQIPPELQTEGCS